jgi:hypothetical protein
MNRKLCGSTPPVQGAFHVMLSGIAPSGSLDGSACDTHHIHSPHRLLASFCGIRRRLFSWEARAWA